VHELALGKIDGFEVGAVHTGPAELSFGDSEYDEIAELGPVTVGAGAVFSLAFSVVGGSVEPLPHNHSDPAEPAPVPRPMDRASGASSGEPTEPAGSEEGG
jgi:hypothetical protein